MIFMLRKVFPWTGCSLMETPSGIIMKINRQPLSSLPEDVLKKTMILEPISGRLIATGLPTTPASSKSPILRKKFITSNFSNFKGDRKFIRDDNATKVVLQTPQFHRWYLCLASWNVGGVHTTGVLAKNETERQLLIKRN